MSILNGLPTNYSHFETKCKQKSKGIYYCRGKGKKNGGKEPFYAVYIKINNQCTESRRL